MKYRRSFAPARPVLLVLLSAATAALAVSTARSAPANDHRKVVIIGFDGADANLVTQWMDEGKLPNLARLPTADPQENKQDKACGYYA